MTPTKTLEEIEKFAALTMAPKEIEIILGLNSGCIANNLKGDLNVYSRAYLKGKLITESEVNKSIINLAKQGSGPAQTMAKRLLADQNAKEVDFE